MVGMAFDRVLDKQFYLISLDLSFSIEAETINLISKINASISQNPEARLTSFLEKHTLATT